MINSNIINEISKLLNNKKIIKYKLISNSFDINCVKIFFKEEIYPSQLKVFLWDKIFSPITIILDFITGYKFGKNVLCVFKKY